MRIERGIKKGSASIQSVKCSRSHGRTYDCLIRAKGAAPQRCPFTIAANGHVAGHCWIEEVAQTVTRAPRWHTPVHPTRPAHSVYNDEIGETIIGQTYRTVVARFGPPKPLSPSAKRGLGATCVEYDIVGQHDGWTFCIRNGRVVSAAAGSAR